jgi:protein tyrosine/serine phosphatase
MISSIANFRDFGGLGTNAGGRIKSASLFRGASLAKADKADMKRLSALDFGLVADLRHKAERDSAPSPWPSRFAERILTHDGSDHDEAPHIHALRKGSLDAQRADALYLELYRATPFDPNYQPLIRRVFARLLVVEAPVLIHCTAGKDRTGMVVALIHHALGVARPDIFADYLRSNTWPGLAAAAAPLADQLSHSFGHPVTPELALRMLRVNASFLDAFFDEIERRSGSIEVYLHQVGMGAEERERLRARWIEA